MRHRIALAAATVTALAIPVLAVAPAAAMPGRVLDTVTVTNPGDQSGSPGDQVDLPMQGSSSDGFALTWSATGLPPSLSFSPVTGLISGTLSDSELGTFGVTVSASDQTGASDSVSFTWTVAWFIQPGGHIRASADTATLKDAATGTTLSCSSAMTGTLKSGTVRTSGLGSITALTFPLCRGPISFTLTASHFPWVLSGVSYDAATGVTTGHISGIRAVLSGPGCRATINGTSATAKNGTVKVQYANSTGQLTWLARGGNLHIYRVSGCAGLINDGDAAQLTGVYTVSPKQRIT